MASHTLAGFVASVDDFYPFMAATKEGSWENLSILDLERFLDKGCCIMEILSLNLKYASMAYGIKINPKHKKRPALKVIPINAKAARYERQKEKTHE